MAVAFASKAQTVTDPWATLGASNIQTAFIAMDASNNTALNGSTNNFVTSIVSGF